MYMLLSKDTQTDENVSLQRRPWWTILKIRRLSDQKQW